MKELVINQPSKRILSMIQKMIPRYQNYIIKDINDDEDKLFYEYFQKGTFTVCILSIDNEIVGLGVTKRCRNDKYNVRVAVDVSTWKAVKDYLIGIAPEYQNLKWIIELNEDIFIEKSLRNLKTQRIEIGG